MNPLISIFILVASLLNKNVKLISSITDCNFLFECSFYDLANVVPTLAKFYHQASESYEQACTRHIAMVIFIVCMAVFPLFFILPFFHFPSLLLVDIY